MTKRKLTILGSLVSAATAAALLFGGAAPASAFQGDNCPAGRLCIWKDSMWYTDQLPNNYRDFGQYIPNYTQYTYRNTNINANDSATSIRNSGISETAYMYRDINKGYQLFSIPVGNFNGSLWGSQGDSISSGYYASFN